MIAPARKRACGNRFGFGGRDSGGARAGDAGGAGARWVRTWCVATLCWGGFGGAPVLAGEFDYGVGYALNYDSNISSVPKDEIAEWTQTLIGGFAYQERSADLNARILAEVRWHDYYRNTYSDNKTLIMNGTAIWTISPQQLVWTTEDVGQQVRLDVTAPDTPTNRANANSLSTGPDLTFRMNSTNTAAFGARYGRLDIEGFGDNVRYSGYARWLHRVSALTTVSLNYEPLRVYYQEPPLYSKTSREDWFIRYDSRFSYDILTIDLGASRLTQDGVETPSSQLARLSATHHFTSRSVLNASFAREFSETSADLLRGAAGVAGPTDAERPPAADVVTSDGHRLKSGELTYRNQDGIFGYNVRGYARRIDYLQLPRDYDEQGGGFGLSWLSPGQSRIRAYTTYLRRSFLDVDRRDTERATGAGVTSRLTPNMNLTIDGARIERASTSSLDNFVDWRVMLLLGYSTGPLYAVGGQ